MEWATMSNPVLFPSFPSLPNSDSVKIEANIHFRSTNAQLVLTWHGAAGFRFAADPREHPCPPLLPPSAFVGIRCSMQQAVSKSYMGAVRWVLLCVMKALRPPPPAPLPRLQLAPET